MSDTPSPGNSKPENEHWPEIRTGDLQTTRAVREADRGNATTWVLVGGGILLLVGVSALVAWRSYTSSRGAAENGPPLPGPPELSADESVQKVTQILRDLPLTEERIRLATSQVNSERKRIDKIAAGSAFAENEGARLGLVYGDLKKARTGLQSKLEPFIKREMIKPAPLPDSESRSIRDLEGFEVYSGPGRDLLDAVDAYDAACLKLLEPFLKENDEGGATWGM